MKKLLLLLLALLCGCTAKQPVTYPYTILDNNDVKVTVNEVTDKMDYYAQINMTFTNKSDKNYDLTLNDVNVNGIWLPGGGGAALTANNSSDVNNFFGTGILSWLGYDKLENLSYSYTLKNGTTEYKTAVFSYSTTDQTTELTMPETAQPLLESDKAKVVMLGVDDGETIAYTTPVPTFYLYIENNSDELLSFFITNTLVNNQDVSFSYSMSVPAKTKTVTACSPDLDGMTKDQIDDITLSLQLTTPKTETGTVSTYTVAK